MSAKNRHIQLREVQRYIEGDRNTTRGDTIVEVLLAFALFVLIAIGAVSIMNRGANMADRSLEITLIREQIDAQAEMLRYARDTQTTAWQAIRDNLGTSAEASQDLASCPSAAQLPSSAFIVNLTDSGEVARTGLWNVDTVYSMPVTFSSFVFRGEPASSGLWVVPVGVEGAPDTFDMHIRACWQPLASSRAETLGTIVRLYDSPAIATAAPPPVPQVCDALESYSNNHIVNGNFSIQAGNGPGVVPAAGFESDLPNRGYNIYPDDLGVNGTTNIYTGGFSLQSGEHWYGTWGHPNSLHAQPFPGDSTWSVPASNTYFYSNPNQHVDDPPGTVEDFEGVLWRQTVSGLEPNTTYDFSGYFDNILLPGSVHGVDPRIQLRADGDPLMSPVTIERDIDEYQRVTLVFTTGPSQTSVLLDIYDYAGDISGDDFGMTALALRRCI